MGSPKIHLPLPPVIKTGSQEWRRLKPVETENRFFNFFFYDERTVILLQTSNLLLKNFSSGLDPLHAKISMHILLTVLYVIPKVLTRRICLKIKSFLLVIIFFILVILNFELRKSFLFQMLVSFKTNYKTNLRVQKCVCFKVPFTIKWKKHRQRD